LHILQQLEILSSLAWCDINTFGLRILWALISPREYLLFPARRTKKYIESTSSPTRGFSVPLLKDLNACPLFSNKLVLFLFHSNGTDLFFNALRLLVFFLCGQIHTFGFTQCRNVDLSKWRTLVIGNVSIRIITKLIIRVGNWVTIFRCWFVLWLSSSITFLRSFFLNRSKHGRWSNWNNTSNCLRSPIRSL